jgi:hypothetical protein
MAHQLPEIQQNLRPPETGSLHQGNRMARSGLKRFFHRQDAKFAKSDRDKSVLCGLVCAKVDAVR